MTQGTGKAELQMRLFGEFVVTRDETPVKSLSARKADKLLAYLVLQGRPVSAHTVATTFWPDTASQESLRQSVRQVRTALDQDGERVTLSDGTLSFSLAGLDVDVLRFDQLVQRGIGGDARDVPALREAAALYAGPLLDGWDEGWISVERKRRRERYAQVLQRLAQAALETGDPATAASNLRTCVELVPSEERAWRALIRALAQAGERLAAIETYERYRAHLHRKGSGLEPPPATTALYINLRAGISDTESTTPSTAAPSDAATEPVGGAVPLASAFYVGRPADDRFCPAVVRQDSLVLVQGPRQSGKSSLLARGLQCARRAGAATAATDLDALAPSALTSFDTLCWCLATQLAQQLDLDVASETVWKPLLGPGVNLERFLVRHVLEQITTPLAWALDGVDRLFDLPFGGEFFSLLRTWHEKRALEPLRPWRRLTVALACATEAHLYIRDLNKSPFNVGTRVELCDFSPDQVADLNRRYHTPLPTNVALAQFQELVGGHPYLVRRGLYVVATGSVSLQDLFAQGAADDGPFGDHLRRLARRLAQNPELATAAQGVIQGKPCPPEAFFRLRSAGVLAGDSDNPRFRCRLYAAYLSRAPIAHSSLEPDKPAGP